MGTVGINGTLYMASNALGAQRANIEITGQNIANVNTPGYARQTVLLKTGLPIPTSIGQQGTGVLAESISQIRSSLLDAQIPSNLSTFSYYEEKSSLLVQVQSNLNQPLDRLDSLAGDAAVSGGDGLAENLETFFNNWQALAADPTSSVLRQQIILSAQAVASKLNSISTNLTNLQSQIASQITQNVDEINTALSNIADLNLQIAKAEIGGVVRANDLRDRRQQLVEDLSKQIGLYTNEENDGSLTVRLGNSAGALLVSGSYAGNNALSTTVKLAVSGAPPLLTIKSYTGGETEVSGNMDTVTPQPSLGILSARIEVANTTIGDSSGGLVRDYNRIAAALANLVNTQHAAGFTMEGSPAYATAGNSTFFDDDSTNGNALGTVTAANIQLNSFVAGDVTRIAASSIAAEPNNGSNASSIANLRSNTTGPSLGSLTISNYYLTALTSLGNNISSTESRASTQKLVVQQLSQQRDSVMGVSLDEETSNLLRFQHAFEASARVLSTVDEMMKAILAIGR